MPKFHRNSDEYGGYSNEKSAIENKASKSFSSTSKNGANAELDTQKLGMVKKVMLLI